MKPKSIIFETAFATYSANVSDVVGEGGAGRVYRVVDESGAEFAVKLLDPGKATNDKRKRFKNELLFGQRNQHANIITVIDSGMYHDGKKSSPFYVMPFYQGSLRRLMSKGIKTSQVLSNFSQLLDGVEAAHLKKVVHRDLKPENVLHDSAADRLLVADFGIARFEEEELYTAVETAQNSKLANFQYAAPEQRARGAAVDRPADIYALGLMLNEMFTGEIPQGTDYRIIGSVAPEFAYLDGIVEAMLRQAPGKRPQSIEAVKELLIAQKNEFITRQRISELDQTVIPVTEISDPLVADPPRLVGADYAKGVLSLQMNRAVNERWISELKNLRSGHSAVYGRGPEAFHVRGNLASVDVAEKDAQRIVDHFKEWLPIANHQYEVAVRAEKRNAEEKGRLELQREKEQEEARLRLLKSIKI